MMEDQAGPTAPQNHVTSTLWRSMFYFNIYRLALSCILLVLALTGASSTGGPHRHPDLFLFTAMGILALSGLYFFTINAARPPFHVQAQVQTSLDLVILTILIHSSDGIQSGYGFLMIVTIAAISLMDSRRSAIAYAAFGTLLALAETIVGYSLDYYAINAIRSPGFLGVGLFSTALVVSQLSQRIRTSEEIAFRRESALADLNALNRGIVELIPTGALAIDKRHRVLVCNGRARNLLRLDRNPEGRQLSEVSFTLQQRLRDPIGADLQRLEEFEFGGSTIQPSIESFGGGAVIFLEDLSQEREQARQVRLAALGRLAAGIAHEIRNPLSAVYQSAQLLSESSTLKSEDAHIAGIIRKQSERIERIIASVLVVSRGEGGNPEVIDLRHWLTGFAAQFVSEYSLPADAVTITGEDVSVRMDTGHLTQVLTNLCANALAHATRGQGELIRLQCAFDPLASCPILEIIDHGTGITADSRRQLFEPFFTTRPEGTGLGLYISRELCEANHARLSFEPDRAETVFRITFFTRRAQDAEAGAGH